MTELSFLLDLLLNHKLPKATRDAVAARIKEVEVSIHQPMPTLALPMTRPTPVTCAQSPSTIAAMERHTGATIPAIPMPPVPVVDTVTVVAQTPATIAAMNHRQQVLNDAQSGKVNKQTGRPQKW